MPLRIATALGGVPDGQLVGLLSTATTPRFPSAASSRVVGKAPLDGEGAPRERCVVPSLAHWAETLPGSRRGRVARLAARRPRVRRHRQRFPIHHNIADRVLGK